MGWQIKKSPKTNKRHHGVHSDMGAIHATRYPQTSNTHTTHHSKNQRKLGKFGKWQTVWACSAVSTKSAWSSFPLKSVEVSWAAKTMSDKDSRTAGRAVSWEDGQGQCVWGNKWSSIIEGTFLDMPAPQNAPPKARLRGVNCHPIQHTEKERWSTTRTIEKACYREEWKASKKQEATKVC